MKQFLLETAISTACTIVLMAAVITELLLFDTVLSLVILPALGIILYPIFTHKKGKV